MNTQINRYFPGGNTVKGFYSYYDEILKYKELNEIYIIKGGPGVGKSTLMKSVGKKFEQKGFSINYYHCSSDPDSLDAVLIKEKGILFVDGTAPHIIDPKYPGALCNLVNLADFLNKEKLKEYKHEIIQTTDKITSQFNCAYKYLHAMTPVYENLNFYYQKSMINQNFYALINYLSEKTIKGQKGKNFKETKLFLSAITHEGVKNFLKETVKAKNIYVLNSNPGDMTFKILENIRKQLELSEFEIECYYCPSGPYKKLEHIIVPELDLAFITSNKYHKFNKGEFINTATLYNLSKEDYEIIDYDSALIDNLLGRAFVFLKSAKSIHDILEDYYKEAMDYKKLDKFSKKIIDSISG